MIAWPDRSWLTTRKAPENCPLNRLRVDSAGTLFAPIADLAGVDAGQAIGYRMTGHGHYEKFPVMTSSGMA